MNILCDEGVDSQIVAQLRHDGNLVLYVAEMEPGISDEIVLLRANQRDALLVTEDKDFGELVFRQGLIHQGVILIRMHGMSSATKAQIVSGAFRQYSKEMPDAFTVIATGTTRIRKRLK